MAENRTTRQREGSGWKIQAPEVPNGQMTVAQRLATMEGLMRSMAGEVKELRTENEKLRDALRTAEDGKIVAEARAVTDELTGLGNRARFNAALSEEIEHYRRYDAGFSIIILDVNDLKLANDTYGHNVGDQLIIAVGKALFNGKRDADVVCRTGGDEFAVVLPHTGFESAERVAARIVEKLKETSLIVEKSGETSVINGISVAVGISNIIRDIGEEQRQAAKDAREEDDVAGKAGAITAKLVYIADKRMYDDKREIKAEQGNGPMPAV
jgi:diguanylate cyclase (GGDEF)-like protein